MINDTSDPAFPALVVEGGCGGIGKKEGVWHYPGMTLRDYFAAKALQALVPMDRNINAIKYAESAYALADAMLKARGEQ